MVIGMDQLKNEHMAAVTQNPNLKNYVQAREDEFILHYTFGSTGKLKGVFHVHNAIIQHYYTGKVVLDLQENDIYWCAADLGWEKE